MAYYCSVKLLASVLRLKSSKIRCEQIPNKYALINIINFCLNCCTSVKYIHYDVIIVISHSVYPKNSFLTDYIQHC